MWGTRKQKLKGERGNQFPTAMVGKIRKKGFKLSAALEILFSFWTKLSNGRDSKAQEGSSLRDFKSG